MGFGEFTLASERAIYLSNEPRSRSIPLIDIALRSLVADCRRDRQSERSDISNNNNDVSWPTGLRTERRERAQLDQVSYFGATFFSSTSASPVRLRACDDIAADSNTAPSRQKQTETLGKETETLVRVGVSNA